MPVTPWEMCLAPTAKDHEMETKIQNKERATARSFDLFVMVWKVLSKPIPEKEVTEDKEKSTEDQMGEVEKEFRFHGDRRF